MTNMIGVNVLLPAARFGACCFLLGIFELVVHVAHSLCPGEIGMRSSMIVHAERATLYLE